MTQETKYVIHGLFSALRSCVTSIVRKLFRLFPQDKIILFESNPDFSDNTYPVNTYTVYILNILLKKFLPDYKHYSTHIDIFNDVYDTIYIDHKGVIEGLKYAYYFSWCRAFILWNQILRKFRKQQLSIFLAHGSETKAVKNLYNMDKFRIDYVNLQSHYFDKSSIR